VDQYRRVGLDRTKKASRSRLVFSGVVQNLRAWRTAYLHQLPKQRGALRTGTPYVRPESSYRAAGDQEPIQGGTPRVGSAKCGLFCLMGGGSQNRTQRSALGHVDAARLEPDFTAARNNTHLKSTRRESHVKAKIEPTARHAITPAASAC
jgi:hypothetical protein